jgi:hypothetical protein
MTRTDTRGLAERKHSVTLRITELRSALRAAEQTAAEIDIAIENAERARESGDRAAE